MDLNNSTNICNFAPQQPFSFDLFSLGVLILEVSVKNAEVYFEVFQKLKEGVVDAQDIAVSGYRV